MQRISSNKRNKRPILIILLCITAGLLTLFIVVSHFRNSRSAKVPGSDVTQSQKKSAALQDLQTKRSVTENQNPKTSTGTTTTPAPQPQTIAVSARQESGGTVTVLTKMLNVADGTCTLMISNSSADYTDQAEIIYQPEYSSCAGFSVPIGKLGTGHWQISVSYTSTGGSGSNATTLDVK